MRLAALLALAFVLAGCSIGGTKTTTETRTLTVTQTVTTQAPLTRGGPLDKAPVPSENARYFGSVVSITQVDAKRYLLVLKPKFFLGGLTANVAFATSQGTTCDPLACPGVDNDYWVTPAGTEDLTFILPAKTKGTVVTGGAGPLKNTPVTVAQLAAIAVGRGPSLFERLDSGLWVTVDNDTVTSFAQQYQP